VALLLSSLVNKGFHPGCIDMASKFSFYEGKTLPSVWLKVLFQVALNDMPPLSKDRESFQGLAN